MKLQHKEAIYAAAVRLIPLGVGFAAGKGWLSQGDAGPLTEALLIIAGVGATLAGSRALPKNRQKLVDEMARNGEFR